MPDKFIFVKTLEAALEIQSKIDKAFGYPREDSRTDHAVGIETTENGFLIPIDLSIHSHIEKLVKPIEEKISKDESLRPAIESKLPLSDRIKNPIAVVSRDDLTSIKPAIDEQPTKPR